MLFRSFLLSTGPAAIPLLLSLVGANYKGVTKKMTMTALLFVAYCAGNIAGPQFFRARDAPHYTRAFGAILVCYGLVVGLALVLRCYLQWINAKREREEGVERSAGAGLGEGDGRGNGEAHGGRGELREEEEEEDDDDDDSTDCKTLGFRYRL